MAKSKHGREPKAASGKTATTAPRRYGPVLFGVALLLFAGFGGWSLLDFGGSADQRLAADDPALVRTGHRIYVENCAACHGSRLEGQPNWRVRRADGRLPAPPHDASGHTWHHPDQQLFELTKYGPAAMAGGGYESDMPAYETVLSDREIVAVLSYIKSRWPPAIQRRHDQINARSHQ